jgi:hypothetical protein
MNKTDKGIISIWMFNIIIILYMLIAWIINLIQFCGCDFKEPYKKEIIKGLGLTGLSAITVWIANDKE